MKRQNVHDGRTIRRWRCSPLQLSESKLEIGVEVEAGIRKGIKVGTLGMQ
jgi:hypothetical protein